MVGTTPADEQASLSIQAAMDRQADGEENGEENGDENGDGYLES